MKIKSFTFNMFSENTYVLYDSSNECVIVDPGCFDPHEFEILQNFIADNNLIPVKLLYTHCHIDHVLGNYRVCNAYNMTSWCHALEVPQWLAIPTYAPMYGFPNLDLGEPPANKLNDGDTIKFGDSTLTCIFAPGHSPGSVCFFNKDEKQLIAGDVLFRMSIGRTDLPGGNHTQLINSIHTKLFVLPDDTIVYPGHMESTTIGFEKQHNPYCGINV